MSSRGYIDPRAVICHGRLSLAAGTFVADRVVIYQARDGGPVHMAEGAHILRDSVIETAQGGAVSIGEDTFLHPRSQVMAYKGSISIGEHVAIGPSCAFYAYNHGMTPGELIKKQPLSTRGGIRIGDGAWLGYGVIVLDGVTIGEGAVIGAGSVVTQDVPADAIAVGSPARIIGFRDGRGMPDTAQSFVARAEATTHDR
jgi:acetyltransferase-like isoleucine patch superfamily enzyme